MIEIGPNLLQAIEGLAASAFLIVFVIVFYKSISS